MNRPACLAALRKTVRFCGCLLAGIALAAPLAFGGVNRWTTSGAPGQSSVNSLAIDPRDPKTVYAGTGHQVFRSRDGGSSWASLPLALSGISFSSWSGLAIDPSSSSNVYAATKGGVFKSVDGGDRWTASGPDSSRANSVAIDPANPSTVFAGTPGGLFKSGDRGASWGRVTSANIYNMVFPSQAPSTIFAEGYTNSSFYYYYYPTTLLHSTDGGGTWNVNSAFVNLFPHALAIDPTNPSTLFAGAWLGGVLKSVDSGRSWQPMSSGLPQGGVQSLIIDPRNPRTLYAGTNSQGVYRSQDGGASWSEFNVGLTSRHVYSMAIDRTGTRLYAGTSSGPIFDYQVYSGALDLAARAGGTRLLFVDPDGRVVFRSFDNSGNSTGSASHGPYSGWYAMAVADGSDGLTRVLWDHLDGSAALWLLGPTSNLASYRYGPTAGWTAVDVSVGRDNTTHLLRTNTDGRTELLSVALSGAVTGNATFGPYTGWLARSISDGSDGLTRLLWSNTDGRIGLSLVDAGRIAATYRLTPPTGWTARDVTVAADNRARVLLVGPDGRAAIWTVDNSGVVTNSERTYEPSAAGQTATRISAGADGLTRVFWTSPEGTGTLWLLDLDNVRQTSFSFGPN